MESTQSIKRRTRAVSSTAQITKAMEMVAATKMRRSQEVALRSRPFAIASLELLAELSARTPFLPALMESRRGGTTLVLVVAADKGLAGPFSSAVARRTEREIFGAVSGTEELVFAAVGKKALEFLERKNARVARYFTNFGDHAEPEETAPLADFLIDGFLRGAWNRVRTVGTHFRTTLRQDVLVRDLLPIDTAAVRKTIEEIVPETGRYAELRAESRAAEQASSFEYLIEPSPEAVLEELARELVRIAVHHLVLEANASEHSARMVAMKNASENAVALKDELSLLYNKARQAGITREIAEITAGAETLNA